MNPRPLSPFLISLALAAVFAGGSRATAAQSSALDLFTSPLSSYRHAAVDAAGSDAMPAAASAVAEESAPSVQKRPETPAPAALRTIRREDAIAALQKQVAAHFGLEGELQLDLVRAWNEPVPSAKALSLSIAEFLAQANSSMLFRVKIEADGTPVSELTLTVRAQLWREAWATRQPVGRDEVFDPSMLELRRVDVFRERDALLATSGDRTQSFTRGIQAGRLLVTRDIAPRSLVRKGEMVEVAAVDGPISVNMKAIALQNGAAGETVSVRNPDTKKDISALVVGEKRVVVRF